MNVYKREVSHNTELSGTKIYTTDKPGPGGAYRNYEIRTLDNELLSLIQFQCGPLSDPNSIKGIQMEDLLSICIDRLECFQNGPFPCIENDAALTHCRAALSILQERTINRKLRDVEGKMIK